jgi:hypothetical protein
LDGSFGLAAGQGDQTHTYQSLRMARVGGEQPLITERYFREAAGETGSGVVAVCSCSHWGLVDIRVGRAGNES